MARCHIEGGGRPSREAESGLEVGRIIPNPPFDRCTGALRITRPTLRVIEAAAFLVDPTHPGTFAPPAFAEPTAGMPLLSPRGDRRERSAMIGSPLERGARRAGCVATRRPPRRSSPTLRILALVAFLVAASAGARCVAAEAPNAGRSLALAATGTISSPRHSTLLADNWHTIALETGAPTPAAVETVGFDDSTWGVVSVPHNWDAYEGFRQVRHGDRHGTAWYRRAFHIEPSERGRRVFLFFEGVGSYATVWVNGRQVGQHAGGLTTFTLDITDAVRFGAENLLVVRADHPAGIRDLPWVCGGCERAYGFSEGTQPFGIFRPVHLITTAPVRVEPFGVHVWNDANVNAAAAQIHLRTELKNYDGAPRTLTLATRVVEVGRVIPHAPLPDMPDEHGALRITRPTLTESRTPITLAAGETRTFAQEPPPIANAHLWSPQSPALYAVETELVDETGMVVDATTTSFGIRSIHWPAPTDTDGRFLVNGEPVFINGICDYEHNLGASHAFTPEQVRARAREIESAGFNAFRDAHHPHNLRFQTYWDADGLLWWPQFGAHIWFDNDAFRANFKALLRDWVKERRNSPSLVLWGLQNESVLPTAFAEECSAIIRELDPTASTQRKITTCNGGTGTDWDVPQNWSGTYGGDPATYADDLRRQKLVGEYGAWRSLGLHTEGGFQARGPLSEDRMAALLETKVRLAESVREAVTGHFMWLFTTHSNPGRNVGEQGEQMADGIRPLDQISPANNKGLFTIWGEPLDAYYMYRANYASGVTDPMVYIVSHTWPDRWTTPGRKSGIIVYSNCEEVELFNDLGDRSLGRRTRNGRGTHFTWDDVEIGTNLLYAEGRIGGKVVARDIVTMHHLPEAPRFAAVQRAQPDILQLQPARTYLYRINCGGPEYVDANGNHWLADQAYTNERGNAATAAEPPKAGHWGFISWAAQFPNLDPRFGSQRKIYDPVSGTRDPGLFQTFRYGRDQLHYVFDVPNGDYDVELYFIEPWYGTGTETGSVVGAVPPPRSESTRSIQPGEGTPPTLGWRVFDVAINGRTELRDLDLAREAGRANAVKKIVHARVTNGRLDISFPHVAAGQAVISAIAIATKTRIASWQPESSRLVTDLHVADTAHAAAYTVRHALDTGDQTYADAPGGFSSLPSDLLEADWLQTASGSQTWNGAQLLEFKLNGDTTVFVARPDRSVPAWLRAWEPAGVKLETNAASGTVFAIYRRSFSAGAIVTLGGNLDKPSDSVPMYSVFIVRRHPAPPPQLVRDLKLVGPDLRAGRSEGPLSSAASKTNDAPMRLSSGGPSGPALPRATGNLRTGREVYADADTRIVSLPANLTDCDLIALPRARVVDGVEFRVNDHVEVYVALDARIVERPVWLSDWVSTRDTITTSDRTAPKFILLRKRYKPDERVRLGPNAQLPDGESAATYLVIVRAVRPAVLLEAETASLTNAAVVHDAADATGSGAVALSPGADHAISWTVSVGVGDRYGVNLRYTAATATRAATGELAIIGADGRTLRTDQVELAPIHQPGMWSVLRTRTGSSINAGTYRFRLTLQGDSPLIIDSLEIE